MDGELIGSVSNELGLSLMEIAQLRKIRELVARISLVSLASAKLLDGKSPQVKVQRAKMNGLIGTLNQELSELLRTSSALVLKANELIKDRGQNK